MGNLLSQLAQAVTPTNLFWLAFVEAIFFPVPPDTLLIPLVLREGHPGPFALLATAGSVAGASVGYLLGRKGGRPLLERLAPRGRIGQVGGLFERYDVWAIGIAGFTPIPYKVFAVGAGVFLIRFERFILASLASRGTRFFVEAVLVAAYGESVVGFLRGPFGWFTLAAAALAVALYALVRRARRR